MPRSPSITLTSAVVIADRYHLKRQLAAGGMGTVWLAHDDKLTRDVAVKILAQQLASHSDLLTRFEREAKAVAQLRSMHVVEVYDFGIHDRLPYIVMECLEGESLRNRLRRQGRLTLRETLIITDQISKGLKAAHAAGLIHRDLKPSNVFLALADDMEIIKLLDFGVVKAVDQGGNTDMTASGTLLGTPQYMSPEQVRARRRIDHRSDLWALGVIVFRLLTGINPFRGESVGDAALRICSDELPKLSDYSDDLSAEFDQFFARAFARDPQQRFQSAEELAGSFRSYCAYSLSDVSLPGQEMAVGPVARPPLHSAGQGYDDSSGAPRVGPSVTPPSTSGVAAVPKGVFGPESGTPPATQQALMMAAAAGGLAEPGPGTAALPPPRSPAARVGGGSTQVLEGRSGDRQSQTDVTRPVALPTANAVGEGPTVPMARASTPSSAGIDADGAEASGAGISSLTPATQGASIPGTSIPLPETVEPATPVSTTLAGAQLRTQLELLKRRLLRPPMPMILGGALAALLVIPLFFLLWGPAGSSETKDSASSASAPTAAATPASDGEVAELGKWDLHRRGAQQVDPTTIDETAGVLVDEDEDAGAGGRASVPPTRPPQPFKRGTTPFVPGKPKDTKPRWF